MGPVDIANVQFDYDLVFAILFMNGHGQVQGRYGGRTPWNAESRVSLAGLKYTMRQILAASDPDQRPKPPPRKELLARSLPGGRGSCMHCHEVWEALRRRQKQLGTFESRSLFVYPRPENIGLTLDVTKGNHVVQVSDKSAAASAGIKPNAVLRRIENTPIYSQADVSWALHNAPEEGTIVVHWRQDGTPRSAALQLDRHWRETKLSWRASMRNEESPARHQK